MTRSTAASRSSRSRVSGGGGSSGRRRQVAPRANWQRAPVGRRLHPVGDLLDLLVLQQPAHQLGARILPCLALLAARQQHLRLEPDQPARHFQIVGGLVEPELMDDARGTDRRSGRSGYPRYRSAPRGADGAAGPAGRRRLPVEHKSQATQNAAASGEGGRCRRRGGAIPLGGASGTRLVAGAEAVMAERCSIRARREGGRVPDEEQTIPGRLGSAAPGAPGNRSISASRGRNPSAGTRGTAPGALPAGNDRARGSRRAAGSEAD